MARSKNPSTKVEEPKIMWITGAIFAATIRGPAHPGRRKSETPTLGVVVQTTALGGDAWDVVAFEARAHGSLQAVLDNHAHKVVGQYESVTEAILSAESYAKAWFKGHKAAQLETTCECTEMEDDLEPLEPSPRKATAPPCYCDKMNGGHRHFHVFT
jgi:hypothetical protein